MRVPHRSAMPGSVPNENYQAMRHDIRLGAPLQQAAPVAAFTAGA